MSPLRNTVGFVNGDTGEFVLVIDCLKVAAEGLRKAKLRSDVEKSGTRMTTPKVV